MAVRVCGESPELSEPQATAQRGVVSLLVPQCGIGTWLWLGSLCWSPEGGPERRHPHVGHGICIPSRKFQFFRKVTSHAVSTLYPHQIH